MNDADSPIFNIKAVIQETGMRADTLRAWERRYDLPHPERSAGGHRLYSRHDIETIRWLMERQEEGLSISNAVDLWNELLAQGKDPLQRAFSAPAAPEPVIQGQTLETLADAWTDACLRFDEPQAEQILARAFALSPVESVCVEVLQKSLSRIGEDWYAGQVTVQQEHFASELAMRRLKTLIAASPPPIRPGKILVAAPPEEEHVFPLLMMTLFIRQRGWQTVYLGANVPIDDLESAVRATSPRLVLSAAQQLVTAPHLTEMAQAVRAMGIPLAYGGRIFARLPALPEHIPGLYLGDRLDTALDAIERYLATPSALSKAEPAAEQRPSAEGFRAHVSLIEADLWQRLGDYLPGSYLTTANHFLARNVEAALTLGDISLMDGEIYWIEGLLHSHEIPGTVLGTYLAAYADAVRATLGDEGAPISEWLDGAAQSMETGGR